MTESGAADPHRSAAGELSTSHKLNQQNWNKPLQRYSLIFSSFTLILPRKAQAKSSCHNPIS